VEGRALINVDSVSVTKFIKEGICRYSIFRKLVVDRGPKNKGAVDLLT